MDFGTALGLMLRKLREQERISQEKLARILDMSRETVRRIEHGDGTTTGTVQLYLDALGRSPDDLLGSIPDRATPPYPAERTAARHLKIVAGGRKKAA